MRLLQRLPGGTFTLTFFRDDPPPYPYAILSHTWIENQEVTYHELNTSSGIGKTGFDKIRFCGEQAAADGLHHFWVDTCCIDRSTSDELSTAINSMFRWYQCASKCYVYLSDVSVPEEVTDAETSRITWIDAFRRSRWFRRGWTLQELIAPDSVEFFSKEGKRLGSKRSLEQEIHEITKIPFSALRGQCLADFGIEERMSWAALRETTVNEDIVYCLLGIFGVFLPLIYGEGEAYARMRLREETQRRQEERPIEWEISDLQLHLRRLEERLDEMNLADKAAKSWTYWKDDLEYAGSVPQASSAREKLLEAIAEKFAAYSELLDKAAHERKVTERRSKRDYSSFRNWFSKIEPHSSEIEEQFIKQKGGLISPWYATKWLDFCGFVETCLRKVYGRFTQKMFATNVRETPNEDHIYYYSQSRVERLVELIITLTVFVLLVLPVVTIYEFTSVGNCDSMLVVVIILVVFTLLFAAALSILTRAKRHEIMAASAAYCAVLVVFIGNFRIMTERGNSCG